jgi:sRNA-binding protein
VSKRSRSMMRPSRRRKGRELLAMLSDLFPKAFAREDWMEHRPLKLHIHLDLTGLLTEHEVWVALKVYTHRRMYAVALTNGGARYDLNGNVAGEVTQPEIEDARKRLAWIDAMQEDRAVNAKAAVEAMQQVRQEENAKRAAEARTWIEARRAVRAASERPNATPAAPNPAPEKTPVRLSSASVRHLSRGDLAAAAAARRARTTEITHGSEAMCRESALALSTRADDLCG